MLVYTAVSKRLTADAQAHLELGSVGPWISASWAASTVFKFLSLANGLVM